MTDLAVWSCFALSDLGREINDTVRPQRGVTYDLFSVPAYAAGHPERIDGSQIGSSKKVVRAGDVLICKINPRINRVWLVGPEDGLPQLASPEYLAFRLSSDFPELGPWLVWYLRSPGFRRWITLNVEGATGSHTRAKSGPILRQSVPIAPRQERETILSAVQQQFTRLDVAEAGLRRVLSWVGVFRRSVVARATSGRLASSGTFCVSPLRPTKSREASQGRTSTAQAVPVRDGKRGAASAAASQDLPHGWQWVGLRDLGELDRGRSRHRPRNDPRLYGGPYPFIQTGDVRQSGGSIRRHTQTYSELGLAQSKLWPAGTLCITIAANIAETAILTYPACFPDSIVGFLRWDDAATTRYVQLCLLAIKDRLRELAPATAQKNINLETLGTLLIPLPPPVELAEIVAEVDRLMTFADVVESAASSALGRVDGLRESVLARLFGRP